MKLGFVSAILPEYTLEAVVSFAQREGFSSVELMCWPPGKSDRRYAGVTHLDVTNLSAGSVAAVQESAGCSPDRDIRPGLLPEPAFGRSGGGRARELAPAKSDRCGGARSRSGW